MPSFLVDEDVSIGVVELLAHTGHDALAIQDLHLKGAKDYVVLLRAAGLARILVTHNAEDFVLLHGAWLLWSQSWGVAPRHAGILVVPQKERLRPPAIVRELDAFVAAELPADNALYVWRSAGGWVRR